MAATTQKTANQIVETLRAEADAGRAAHSQRLGIREVELLGVSVGTLRKIAKQYGPDDKLADALWATNIHEARLIAVLCADPAALTPKRLNGWLKHVTTWDLCDTITNQLVRYGTGIDKDKLITQWAKDKRLYMRRAALATIAGSAVHDKSISDKSWQLYLGVIQSLSDDDRLHVKKAASWALREMGKRSEIEHEMILDVVHPMAQADNATTRWIARDALKELYILIAVPERKRLVSTKSKTGKAALAAMLGLHEKD